MVTENEALIAENEKLKMMVQDLMEQRDKAYKDCITKENENEEILYKMNALKSEMAELRKECSRAEGKAEAYAHCIDAMNGIQHGEKIGFRHAD